MYSALRSRAKSRQNRTRTSLDWSQAQFWFSLWNACFPLWNLFLKLAFWSSSKTP